MWEDIVYSLIGRFNIVKMAVLTKNEYKDLMQSQSTLQQDSCRNWQTGSKICRKYKWTKITTAILIKKQSCRTHTTWF